MRSADAQRGRRARPPPRRDSGAGRPVAVSRETEAIAALAARYQLPSAALTALYDALAAEQSPPTAVRHGLPAVETHIADSLAGLEAEELVSAERIADVGAGAGFPGLVLAASIPAAHVDLIEAGRRKVAVIGRLAAAASLRNARPVQSRAEQWAMDEGSGAYDAVTVRALGPLALLVEYAAPLLRDGGVLVAWKGQRHPEEEHAGAVAADIVGLALSRVLSVTPYKGSGRRHLYVYSKVRDTPDRFPRRPGMAAKRPLA